MPHYDLEPSIGRTVHYVPEMTVHDDHPVCRAAIVVAVMRVTGSHDVDLTVMEPFGITHKFSIQHDETLQKTNGLADHAEDTWHWPELVNTGFSMRVKGE